jgi:mannose-6-phosphate isomerase-like protein (cupin superfamily)
MNKEGKIWGENILIFQNDNIQINQIYIKKGGRCSKHLHKNKNNLFFVQSGKLHIEKWCENGMVDNTILTKQQQTIIPNMVYHRFTALEDTEALEIYFMNIEENDILRADMGSIIL